MPRYLTAPSRFLVIISTFVVALVLLLASAVMAAGPAPETVDYRVRSGDSLWTIAEVVAPEGNDIRGVISEIRHLNDLDSSLITPGQTLLGPAGREQLRGVAKGRATPAPAAGPWRCRSRVQVHLRVPV